MCSERVGTSSQKKNACVGNYKSKDNEALSVYLSCINKCFRIKAFEEHDEHIYFFFNNFLNYSQESHLNFI